MTTIKNWQDIIGSLEIVVGSFLILPLVIILALLGLSSSLLPPSILSQTIMKSPSIFGLATHTHSSYGDSITDTFGGFFILNGFFWIGIILLINGVWKIKSIRRVN